MQLYNGGLRLIILLLFSSVICRESYHKYRHIAICKENRSCNTSSKKVLLTFLCYQLSIPAMLHQSKSFNTLFNLFLCHV